MKPEMMKNIAVVMMAAKALASSRENLSDEDDSAEFWRDFAADLNEDDRAQETREYIFH